MLRTVSPSHILHYNVHKLSNYKKQFVYIIKEFVCYALCLLQHILHCNEHRLSNDKKEFVYIIKKFVLYLFCLPPHILHYNVHKLLNYTYSFKSTRMG